MPRHGAAGTVRQLLERELQKPHLITAMAMVQLEERADGTVMCRMPGDVELFNELWSVVQGIVKVYNNGGGHKRKLVLHRASHWPTVSELADMLGQIKWLWEKWIPVGFLTLLVGEPGTGKSLVALDWVKRIVQCTVWPNGDPNLCRQQFAIWIETESSQQILTTRSRTMQIPGDRIIVPGFGGDVLGQPDLMSEPDKERMVRAIEECKPGLVVLDSLGGAHTRGENRVEDVRPMLDFLARLSRDKVVPIVAIHHLRKRAAGEDIEISLDRVRGSTAFSAFARGVIALDGANTRQLRVLKSNLSNLPQPMVVEAQFNSADEVTNVKYTPWSPPPPKRTRAERCAEWVVGRLSQDEVKELGMPLVQIVEEGGAQGYTRNMIYAARDILGDELLVTGTGRSATWQLVTHSKLFNTQDVVDGLNGVGE